jgi:Uma2 family endonuclease
MDISKLAQASHGMLLARDHPEGDVRQHREYPLTMSTESVIKKLFTVDEYHRMWDAGILPEEKRFELIRGEIIEMPNPKPPHSGRANRLNHLFSSRLGDSVVVSVQNPSSIDDMSEPVPDVSLLKPRSDFYTERHPLPEDVLLAIEISYSTFRFDSKIKAPLYAEAGIREYWILNIPSNALEVHTLPVLGKYTHHQVLKHGQTISPQAFPAITFSIEEILG